MDRKSGFTSILVLILIVGIGVAAGAFYLTQKNTSSEKIKSSFLTTKTNTKNNSRITFKKVSEAKLLFTNGYADPTIIKLDNGTLVLYVNKFGPGGSGYRAYTSTDGLTWKEKTNVSLPNASTGRVVRFDNKIRFYYPGLQPIKPTDPPATIMSSISNDGFSFAKESGDRVVPKSGYYLEGPTVIKLSNGKFRMYFNENETASKEKRVSKIYAASSVDGLAWTREEKHTLESDQVVEKATEWSQALHPFVLVRPKGGYVMFYNTHSKIYAATSTDGLSWTKVGYVGIEGADVDGYYLPDGTLRLYYGNFSPQTSGVVYTVDLKEE